MKRASDFIYRDGGLGLARRDFLKVVARRVVNSRGRPHQVANLSVAGGSILPTRIGADPQLLIFALTAQKSSALVNELGR